MKVLYQLPYQDSTGADRWIADAWRGGFEYFGHQFEYWHAHHIDADAIAASGAGLLMTDIHQIDGLKDFAQLEALRAKGVKVAIWVHWPLDADIAYMAEDLKRRDIADVYYGERESDCMGDFETATGKRYLCLPNAADHRYHFPAPPDPLFAYDIVFLGTRLPRKKWMNELIEKRLQPRFRVGLFGQFWTRRNRMIAFVARAARKLRIMWLAGFIDRRRVQISLEMERVLYSSAKICINFHERCDDGSIDHSIVNQRTFKIAASGGFQVADDAPGVLRYFSPDEIVSLPLDQDLWVETIARYVADDATREEMRRRSTARAMGEHYSYHRVQILMGRLGVQG
jgi:spore maturation protein CgeB